MITHVKLATPDPDPSRKPTRPRLSACVLGRLATPELKAALDAVRAQGGDIPNLLRDA